METTTWYQRLIILQGPIFWGTRLHHPRGPIARWKLQRAPMIFLSEPKSPRDTAGARSLIHSKSFPRKSALSARHRRCQWHKLPPRFIFIASKESPRTWKHRVECCRIIAAFNHGTNREIEWSVSARDLFELRAPRWSKFTWTMW